MTHACTGPNPGAPTPEATTVMKDGPLKRSVLPAPKTRRLPEQPLRREEADVPYLGIDWGMRRAARCALPAGGDLTEGTVSADEEGLTRLVARLAPVHRERRKRTQPPLHSTAEEAPPRPRPVDIPPGPGHYQNSRGRRTVAEPPGRPWRRRSQVLSRRA